MAVAAGSEGYMLLAAVSTLINYKAALRGSTFHDGINDFPMLIGHGIPK